jgi:hypothetical protein
LVLDKVNQFTAAQTPRRMPGLQQAADVKRGKSNSLIFEKSDGEDI